MQLPEQTICEAWWCWQFPYQNPLFTMESKYHKQKHWRRSPSPGIFFRNLPSCLLVGLQLPIKIHMEVSRWQHIAGLISWISPTRKIGKWYDQKCFTKILGFRHCSTRHFHTQILIFWTSLPASKVISLATSVPILSAWWLLQPFNRPQADHWSKLQAVVVQSPANNKMQGKNDGCHGSPKPQLPASPAQLGSIPPEIPVQNGAELRN